MTPFHFGQVNFNMSSVIRVVFFINKVKTIWLVILTNEQWTISLVKLFKYFFYNNYYEYVFKASR
jgi:hypothetical protein